MTLLIYRLDLVEHSFKGDLYLGKFTSRRIAPLGY